jgi:hypothetical protein
MAALGCRCFGSQFASLDGSSQVSLTRLLFSGRPQDIGMNNSFAVFAVACCIVLVAAADLSFFDDRAVKTAGYSVGALSRRARFNLKGIGHCLFDRFIACSFCQLWKSKRSSTANSK